MKKRCPDRLTIQAVLDGEENGAQTLEHLRTCPECKMVFGQIREAVLAARILESRAKLPPGFYLNLAARTAPRSLPWALLAAAAFLILVGSALLADPGSLTWWLSAGITRQFALALDALFDLLFVSHAAGPAAVVTVLALLVALEALVLNMLNNAEVRTDA